MTIPLITTMNPDDVTHRKRIAETVNEILRLITDGDVITAAQVLTLLLTVDGAGSGLDADLLDGQSGSYYSPALLLPRTFTSSDNTVASDNGKMLYYTGGSGDTFTIDSDFGVEGNLLSIANNGGGSLSIAESLSGTMSWFAGTGAPATGTRTLARGGICSVWMIDANNAGIWGTGLT